jgi:hypothetical protein
MLINIFVFIMVLLYDKGLINNYAQTVSVYAVVPTLFIALTLLNQVQVKYFL